MKKNFSRALVLFLVIGGIFFLGWNVAMANADGYDLSWWTVDGGGGTSVGSGYTVNGTIGQPDAGIISGGAYTLNGGFWHIETAASYNLYLPVVLRNAG